MEDPFVKEITESVKKAFESFEGISIFVEQTYHEIALLREYREIFETA